MNNQSVISLFSQGKSLIEYTYNNLRGSV